ncbi:MAG: Hpt domain-containing protein [Desulfovibrionaceae bacterium]
MPDSAPDPASDPVSAPCPLTQAFLDSMRGKEAFLNRLFTVFVTEEPKRIEEIRQVLARNDRERLRYLAHSLKGSAATMGAETLKDCCKALELASEDNDPAGVDRRFAELEAEIGRVFAYMQARLDF